MVTIADKKTCTPTCWRAFLICCAVIKEFSSPCKWLVLLSLPGCLAFSSFPVHAFFRLYPCIFWLDQSLTKVILILFLLHFLTLKILLVLEICVYIQQVSDLISPLPHAFFGSRFCLSTDEEWCFWHFLNLWWRAMGGRHYRPPFHSAHMLSCKKPFRNQVTHICIEICILQKKSCFPNPYTPIMESRFSFNDCSLVTSACTHTLKHMWALLCTNSHWDYKKHLRDTSPITFEQLQFGQFEFKGLFLPHSSFHSDVNLLKLKLRLGILKLYTDSAEPFSSTNGFRRRVHITIQYITSRTQQSL